MRFTKIMRSAKTEFGGFKRWTSGVVSTAACEPMPRAEVTSVNGGLAGKDREKRSLSSAGVLALVLLSQNVALGWSTSGPLRASKENPRYFRDASGKIVYLAGSQSGGWDLQDDCWSGYCKPNAHIPADFEKHLKLARAHNHNFIRLWIVESTLYDRGPKDIIAHPMPYLRSGPGKALDGRPKFDLTRFDPENFSRLRAAVSAARDKDVYVSVMLFEAFSSVRNITGGAANPWFGHPFNASNNINGIEGDANGDGKATEYHSLATPAVTDLQKAYVRKVIDTVNEFDNVLYEIANESLAGSKDWQCELIRAIKTHESTKPTRHPVIMSGGGPGSNLDIQALLAGPADAIAPAGGPPVASGAKVAFADQDHNGWTNKDAGFVWKSFLRGNNVIIFDMHAVPFDWHRGEIVKDDKSYEPLRDAVGQTRAFAGRMNLAELIPKSELSTTGYCLANSGKEYLVYQPKSGKFSMQLLAGEYSYEWFDATAGRAAESGTISIKKGKRKLTPPFTGHAVLYLKAN